MQDFSLHLHDGTLQGALPFGSTGTALDLGATYNSVCENLVIFNVQRGIHYKFCLMGTIRNCRSNAVTYCPFLLDIGDWFGATNFNSQSNVSKLEQCRVNNIPQSVPAGQWPYPAEAAFIIRAASGVIMSQCISEGGKPNHHVIFDSDYSTIALDGRIDSMHLESEALVSGIFLTLTGGRFEIVMPNTQISMPILIDVETYAYPHLHIRNWPYIPPATQLRTVDGGAFGRPVLIFEDTPDSVNPASGSLWVGGVPPTYYGWYGYNQSPFIKGEQNVTIQTTPFN